MEVEFVGDTELSGEALEVLNLPDVGDLDAVRGFLASLGRVGGRLEDGEDQVHSRVLARVREHCGDADESICVPILGLSEPVEAEEGDCEWERVLRAGRMRCAAAVTPGPPAQVLLATLCPSGVGILRCPLDSGEEEEDEMDSVASWVRVDLQGCPESASWSSTLTAAGPVLVVGDSRGRVHFLTTDGSVLFSQPAVRTSTRRASSRSLPETIAKVGFSRPPAVRGDEESLLLVSTRGPAFLMRKLRLRALAEAAQAGDVAALGGLRSGMHSDALDGSAALGLRNKINRRGGIVSADVQWTPECTQVFLAAATSKPNEPALVFFRSTEKSTAISSTLLAEQIHPDTPTKIIDAAWHGPQAVLLATQFAVHLIRGKSILQGR